jgi:hypothetical protein
MPKLDQIRLLIVDIAHILIFYVDWYVIIFLFTNPTIIRKISGIWSPSI